MLKRLLGESRGLGLALPTIIYLLIFFIIPLLFMFVMSLMTRGEISSSYELPLNIDNYTAIFEDPLLSVLVRSVRIALVSTIFCLLIGYPLAFFISTRQNRLIANLTLFLVILPFWTNFLVRTYVWQIILGRRGIINELLMNQFEIIERPLSLLFTEEAVIVGLVYGFLPFMVLPIYATLERFNFRLAEAAYDLGANDWFVFWRVLFPITLPGVVAGVILVFIPSIGAFVTPALLGGTEGYMIGNLIDRQFKDSGGSYPLGAGSSIVIMAMVMIALFVYLRYADEESYQRSGNSFLAPIFRAFWSVIAIPLSVFNISKGKNLDTREIVLNPIKIQRDLWLRRIGRVGLWLNPIFSYIFLWLPIVLLAVYSFNASRRAGGRWEGFTTEWYEGIWNAVVGNENASSFSINMLEALQVSLQISFIATFVSVVMGTMISLAMVRGHFRGKGATNGMLYLPVVIPDITMGVSLLIFFKIVYDTIESLSGTRYFPTVTNVIIAHVAFNISFVAIVVRARLQDMNPRLEEAARDLGANEWRTFWRVTYPLLLPGIIAGALLAFTLSLDDFVVTFFTGGGSTTTLTVYVWGAVRRGVSPEINAVSTLMILASMMLIGISLLLQGRNASRA